MSTPKYSVGFDSGSDDQSVICIFDGDTKLLVCEEIGWLVDLVRLAHEYREVASLDDVEIRRQSDLYARVTGALLDHAYNGGKAP